jgi:hypothetical protein
VERTDRSDAIPQKSRGFYASIRTREDGRCISRLRVADGNHALTWPLQSILSFASSKQEFRDASKSALDGEFGDLDDWLQAEARWLNENILEDDLLWIPDRGIPYDKSIKYRGVPHGAFNIVDGNAPSLTRLVTTFRKMLQVNIDPGWDE